MVNISFEKLKRDLKKMGWGEVEIEAIICAVCRDEKIYVTA
jgi:hypothetical protein